MYRLSTILIAFAMLTQAVATHCLADDLPFGTLSNAAINESSGIAVGHKNPKAFFTHNDGSEAILYAFDAKGNNLGAFTLTTKARDVEDIGSFVSRGKNWIFMADTGDNKKKRDSYEIFFFEEPSTVQTRKKNTGVNRIANVKVMRFVYEDGSHNCEAVAMDPASGMIYLVEKNDGESCRIYEMPSPFSKNAPAGAGTVTARAIAVVDLKTATGMDISADGMRAIICTYNEAYEFSRSDAGETWKDAFTRKPEVISLPGRKQGEAICYDASGDNCWLTSENEDSNEPCPLFKVSLAAQRIKSKGQ